VHEALPAWPVTRMDYRNAGHAGEVIRGRSLPPVVGGFSANGHLPTNPVSTTLAKAVLIAPAPIPAPTRQI
jgi:hypothetical protein